MKKSIKFFIVFILILIGFISYLIYLRSISAKYMGADNLYLQEIYFDDVPELSFILYDIVNHVDSDGYTSQYPYYYAQVSQVSDVDLDSFKREIFRIDLQWKSTDVCKNDTAIGYLGMPYPIPQKFFIITSTYLDVGFSRTLFSNAGWCRLPLSEDSFAFKDDKPVLIKRELIRPDYDRDSTIEKTAILTIDTYPDTVKISYRLGYRRVDFDISEYYTIETTPDYGNVVWINPKFFGE